LFNFLHLPQIEVLNKYLFLTSKPVIYLVNLSDKDFIRKKNKWLIKIKEWVDKNDPGATIIPFSGAYEFKLVEIEDDAERQAYIEEQKCPSVLSKIILAGFTALHLEYFFTAGADEVKAWTIQKGTKAPQVRKFRNNLRIFNFNFKFPRLGRWKNPH
jgi:obg-like ATPase 1